MKGIKVCDAGIVVEMIWGQKFASRNQHGNKNQEWKNRRQRENESKGW